MTGGLYGKLVGAHLAAVHPHRVVFAQLEIEGQLEEDASYDVPGQGGKTNTKLESVHSCVGRGSSNMSDQSMVGAARTYGLRQYHQQPLVESSSSSRAKRRRAPR